MRARRVSLVLALSLGFALACGIDLEREQGVCLPDQIDETSWSHIRAQIPLEDGETVRVFYDASITLDGTDMSLVTDRRVITHRNGITTALSLSEVTRIGRVDDVIGEAIEVGAAGGRMVRVPIAPLNGIDTFEAVLRSAQAAHE